MDRRVTHRAAVLAALILTALAAGTVCFRVLEGYSYFDAFYMTLITITTVGYQEIHPLSYAGRIFNSLVILFGVSAMFVAVGAVTQTIIELGLEDRYGDRRKRRAIMKLSGHYIICGYGRVGRSAALELQRAGADFIVIDTSTERVERASQAGMLAVAADARRDDSLRDAGIERAKGFIAALATDADNVFVILSAKTLNPKLTVVTRASEEDAEEKLRRAGADTVYSPYSIAGHRLAQSLLRPNVARVLDQAAQSVGLDVGIEQLKVAKESRYATKTLAALLPECPPGVMVVAIHKADGRMIFNPPHQTHLVPNDLVIAMGDPSNLRVLEGLLNVG